MSPASLSPKRSSFSGRACGSAPGCFRRPHHELNSKICPLQRGLSTLLTPSALIGALVELVSLRSCPRRAPIMAYWSVRPVCHLYVRPTTAQPCPAPSPDSRPFSAGWFGGGSGFRFHFVGKGRAGVGGVSLRTLFAPPVGKRFATVWQAAGDRREFEQATRLGWRTLSLKPRELRRGAE